MSGLHAMHSIGGIAGAALGALLARLDVGRTAHFSAVAVMAAVAAGYAATRLPVHAASREHVRRPPVRAWVSGWTPLLLVLGVLAFCLTLAEGSALDWSSVFMKDARHAGPSLAAGTVMAFMTAM